MEGIVAAGYVAESRVERIWADAPPPPRDLAAGSLARPFLRIANRSFSLIPIGAQAAFWMEYGSGPRAYHPPRGHQLVLAALRRRRLLYGPLAESVFGEELAAAAVDDLESLAQARGQMLDALGFLGDAQTLGVTVVAEALGNLLRHGGGGAARLYREGGIYTLRTENRAGGIRLGDIATPLLHPLPSHFGKGFFLLLALGAHVHIDPTAPARVSISFLPWEPNVHLLEGLA